MYSLPGLALPPLSPQRLGVVSLSISLPGLTIAAPQINYDRLGHHFSNSQKISKLCKILRYTTLEISRQDRQVKNRPQCKHTLSTPERPRKSDARIANSQQVKIHSLSVGNIATTAIECCDRPTSVSRP